MSALTNSPVSLWLDAYGPYNSEPPLQDSNSVDVVIIGGSFAGIANAYELKRVEPGLEIAVLEVKTVGYGASRENGGQFG